MCVNIKKRWTDSVENYFARQSKRVEEIYRITRSIIVSTFVVIYRKKEENKIQVDVISCNNGWNI